MFGRTARQWLSLVLFASLLAACQPEVGAKARQIIVEWPENQLLFIADERTGGVKAFRLGAGAPVFTAQTRVFERSTVRDIMLDPARNQLWVLGADGVYVHDARNLALLKRIPLNARDVAGMVIEEECVILLAADGVQLGRIDTATLLALWHPALSVRRG